MRVLALDYGSARCGCALSDPTGTIVTPIEAVAASRHQARLRALRELVREREVERVIVGLPLSLDGGDTEQTRETRAFADELAAAPRRRRPGGDARRALHHAPRPADGQVAGHARGPARTRAPPPTCSRAGSPPDRVRVSLPCLAAIDHGQGANAPRGARARPARARAAAGVRGASHRGAAGPRAAAPRHRDARRHGAADPRAAAPPRAARLRAATPAGRTSAGRAAARTGAASTGTSAARARQYRQASALARGATGGAARARGGGRGGGPAAARLATSKTVPPAAPTVVKVLIPEGKTRAQIAQIAAAAGLTGSYRVASRRSPLLNPAAYGAPEARRTSKASCSRRPTTWTPGAPSTASSKSS